jgi:signal transduction histidine kinase
MRMPEQSRPQAVGHHHRVPPRVADGLTALLLLSLATAICIKMASDHPGADTPAVLLTQAAVFSTLIFRNAYPRIVLLLSTLGYAGVLWHLDGVELPLVLAPAAAMVAVAARGDRRTTILCWGGACGVLVVSESLATGEVFRAGQVGVLVWLGFFAAAGEAVQSKKAYVAAIEERALRAEHTREEEARRRVAEERLRIAQELHDVVAHHIAVIHVQASVAEHLVTEKPAEAAEALTHVRRSSRTVLDELTGLLNVLRQPGDSKTPIEPAAGVEDLPQLIHSFESSGLRVSWAVRGERRPLPPALDLVAYRLVQEGLTNAHKHGSGSATLDVRFTGEAILIDLTNESGARAEPGEMGPDSVLGGYGLIGMRERALAVGGSLRAAPEPDGTWRVRARLPIRAEKVPAAKKPAAQQAQPVVVKVAAAPAAVAVNTCVTDLRKLPARLIGELSEREPGRPAAQESM